MACVGCLGFALLDWSRIRVEAQSVRAKRGEATGPNPTDRGKSGSKIHPLIDGHGLPLTCAVSAANVHDGHTLQPLGRDIPAVRSRRGPRRRRPGTLQTLRTVLAAASARGQPFLRSCEQSARVGGRLAAELHTREAVNKAGEEVEELLRPAFELRGRHTLLATEKSQPVVAG